MNEYLLNLCPWGNGCTRLIARNLAAVLVLSVAYSLVSTFAGGRAALADEHGKEADDGKVSSVLSEFAQGRLLVADELAQLPPVIHADGEGLPEGSGDALTGAEIYADSCAGCHGSAGQGGSALELVGDRTLLASEYPDRGIAVFWPYAPPLFDYVRRAMPPEAPWSLSADETYAVVAHLLDLNGLLPASQRVDAAFLSDLAMPNRDGFIDARID